VHSTQVGSYSDGFEKTRWRFSGDFEKPVSSASMPALNAWSPPAEVDHRISDWCLIHRQSLNRQDSRVEFAQMLLQALASQESVDLISSYSEAVVAGHAKAQVDALIMCAEKLVSGSTHLRQGQRNGSRVGERQILH
jgi:hypothetical protein